VKHILRLSFLVIATINPLASSAAAPASFSQAQICRATIGAIMGRDPKIIKADKVDAGVVYVSYIRPSDGTAWNQRCMFNGARVIWATETGRWRADPADEVISYAATQTTLTIQQKFTDGSMSSNSYTRAQLGKN
jgi:hypothetical protein